MPEPLQKTGHAKAKAAAVRKRQEADAQGLGDDFVAALVEGFYARIRADAMLGPIFAARITDWEPHLARMNRFWRSILHGSGEFTGNPMQTHMALPGLDAEHFGQWLELFYATLRELGAVRGLVPEALRLVALRGRMIAESLLTGIEVRAQGLAGARTAAALPHYTL